MLFGVFWHQRVPRTCIRSSFGREGHGWFAHIRRVLKGWSGEASTEFAGVGFIFVGWVVEEGNVGAVCLNPKP